MQKDGNENPSSIHVHEPPVGTARFKRWPAIDRYDSKIDNSEILSAVVLKLRIG
jgi:hypothetical protein